MSRVTAAFPTCKELKIVRSFTRKLDRLGCILRGDDYSINVLEEITQPQMDHVNIVIRRLRGYEQQK